MFIKRCVNFIEDIVYYFLIFVIVIGVYNDFEVMIDICGWFIFWYSYENDVGIKCLINF